MVITPIRNASASRPQSTSIKRCIWTTALLFFLHFGLAGSAAQASSMIYKNYIVRYDRGWDILCEPYVVQKGDWVLKIFRQKGEIAHKDFRDFLGIFQRLNPHVPDMDMIRPGQAIDIPLRKLEHGTLPGQSSGVVTIPIVSLTKVTDVLHQNSEPYKVQRGDTVSKLLAGRFGRYGTQSYNEGVKMLQAANPQITDINLIYAGQTIHIPDPSIREKEWYEALYDEQGNLRDNIDRGRTPPAAATAPGEGGAAAFPHPAPQAETHRDVLSRAAAMVGAKLLDKGTYFIPRSGEADFEIDLSRHPLLDMQSDKLLFTRDGKVMDEAAESLQSKWPEGKIVPYNDQASVDQIVAAIFEAMTPGGAPSTNETGFADHGIMIAVRSKWIKTEGDQRRLCITPIDSPDQQTPESMRRYLEQHGIVLREILPGGQTTAGSNGTGRHAVKDILALTPTGQKDFLQRVARILNLSYAPDIAVNFTYAGMQLQAYANLVSSQSGSEVLVDFGDLYGDAIKAIRQSGLNVVQISHQDSHTTIVRKVLTGLGEPYSENPAFLAAARPAEYNTTITVPGILYSGAENKRTLLSGANLHPAISDVLSTGGIAVVTW